MQNPRTLGRIFGVSAAVALAAALLAAPAYAADVTLDASDGFGNSSFNSAGNWDNDAAPSAGNDYFTGDFILRTPPDANSHTFAGDSLTVNNTTAYPTGLFYKGNGTTGIVTIADLILDGGLISHGQGIDALFQLDGAITVLSPSTIYAKQGNIDILAEVSGSADLTFPVTDAPGEDNRYVTFFGANTGFSGNLDVAGRFRLDETGGLTFVIGAAGVNNAVSGSGSAVYNGVFTFDVSGASANPGDTWTIASVANQTYGATFAVASYTETIPGVWDGPNYWFDASTGVLSYGEPPSLTGVFLSTGGDAIGESSFDNDGANNWDDGLDPSAGKDYVVTVQYLRSPADAVDYTFQGDTLTFKSGGALISKHTGSRMLTAPWILDGGLIRSGSGGDVVETLAGTMEITSNGGQINADQTPYVVTADVTGDEGTLTLGGGFGVAFAGTNAFTGDVNASGTNHEWQSGSSWLFEIGAPGVNNQIAGGGSAAFNGAFVFDLTNATNNPGDAWTIVDVATQTFGANFSVTGFTESSPGIWANNGYRFNEGTGVLAVGAPAGTWDGDVSDLWSVAANWSADALPNFFGFVTTPSFADIGAVGGTLTNDIVGAELAGIEFLPGIAQSFILAGNAVDISGPVANASSNGQEIAFDMTGTLEFDAAFAPITASGALSGTNGLTQLGDAPVILSNSANDFSGPVDITGTGDIVVTGSGALGAADDESRIQLNASFQGPMTTLVLNGGVTQEKVYALWARTVSDPAHIISTNGVNTMDGRIDIGSGGDRVIIRSEADSSLIVNADWVELSFAFGTDTIRFDGDGTITVNGELDDSDDDATLAVLKANGDLGTLEIVGPKTHNGATQAASGTLALIDGGSSNNVTSSGLLETLTTNGVLDFSGLAGGGIVLEPTQTLAGLGNVLGGVQAVSGSTIAPGSGGVGTLPIEHLTLDAGATINVELGSTATDRIDILAGGSLTGPSSGQVNINIDIGGEITPGVYPLLDWSVASTVTDVDLADFVSNFGALSIDGSQLVLTIALESRGKMLVSDTGNFRVLKYDITQFGTLSPDAVQPVFAEGVVGLYELESPTGMALDSAGNVYIAEGRNDLEDRILKLDANGNHLATVAGVFLEPAREINGTPAHIVVDPTDSYLFISIAEPNSAAFDTTLEDVIYRVDLSGATAPVVYIDTTDVGGNYELQDPQGLAFGPDGYLYVSNNLDPASTSPDPGSRVLRFDVSGSTGVYAGTLTTEHREAKGLSYDEINDRLLVSINELNDIWAYTDLTQDYIPNSTTNGAFESVLEQDASEDYPDVAFASGNVYFTDSTNDVVKRVASPTTAGVALGAGANLLDPHSLLVIEQFDPFDFDADGDIDGDDWEVFALALSGPGVTSVPPSVTTSQFDQADSDNDGDVDLEDAAEFMRRITP